jgi:7,8-dihydropterin-6-yl-methyl-4-(beta-D-ribofuranosyl)aminobenzene 5'-phosphate synthase
MGEWGLAVLVETGDSRVLLDTGWGLALAHNARELGVDLSHLDALALSHGHLDHTGGLDAVLALNQDVPIYMHQHNLSERFAKHGGPQMLDIGIPPKPAEALRRAPNKLFVAAPTEIVPGLWTTGPVPRVTPEEGPGGVGFLDRAETAPDTVLDDFSFWVETDEGLVVLLGCAHAGTVNILAFIEKFTANAPIYAVLGGMHLMDVSQARMDVTVDALRALDVRLIGPCHCTGVTETFKLRQEFPDRFAEISAGTTLELPLRPE